MSIASGDEVLRFAQDDGLFDLHTGVLDDPLPLDVLERDVGFELLARFLGRDEGEALELIQHLGVLEDSHDLGADLVEDRLGRLGGRREPDPAHGDDALDALLGDGRHVGQEG